MQVAAHPNPANVLLDQSPVKSERYISTVQREGEEPVKVVRGKVKSENDTAWRLHWPEVSDPKGRYQKGSGFALSTTLVDLNRAR